MVDDDFHILGIIDWEFTSTIPQQIYIPPPWITGHDPDTLLMVTGVPRDQIWLEFRRVLEELHKTSSEQMELHIQKSERYTEYLRNNNLLIPYERPQQIQEFLKRAKALLQAGEARHGKEIEE
ncbi:hypothetical protein H634G_09752 [Metarhizium anisopliae BRIP 53293]|uniref:Aminoglycoside phosphotransferase domain-containing protein n=1 Tax=Metarhizium anisopliae BRIP 53293 TaxID=1291518 RepID=A0A0D9NMB9_METAN|nr:hypothetical protein H634G_09752 [Metarhizium anisopliae BRIP 53293]KJK93633.1 hypothetical protein H633G_02511 [Metarhizium anisopliae BRIP 53284]